MRKLYGEIMVEVRNNIDFSLDIEKINYILGKVRKPKISKEKKLKHYIKKTRKCFERAKNDK